MLTKEGPQASSHCYPLPDDWSKELGTEKNPCLSIVHGDYNNFRHYCILKCNGGCPQCKERDRACLSTHYKHQLIPLCYCGGFPGGKSC